MHSDKKFKCDICEKGFPLESTLKSHRVKCGVTYSCYCGVQYKSPEAFLTHTKRKQHNIGLGYSTIMKFDLFYIKYLSGIFIFLRFL